MVVRGIPEEIVDEIRHSTDLADLIGEYIKLERRGRNMVGLCPFHNEKTPSFTVSGEKQLYHCFGCGASGNVFSFIMQLEKMTFPEAAKFLAKKAGVKIPVARSRVPGQESLKEKIYRVNMFAARYYAYQLTKNDRNKKALNYLLARGIKPASIETFMLGYATEKWDGFLNFARKKGLPVDLLVKAGLVSPGKEYGHYDRFRSRIIFPIFDLAGRVVGFGGRILEEGPKMGPKYLNSPETAVFNKKSLLYGLNFARTEIRREKTAVVTEGYTDVIASYQAGIKNVVASLGTALTGEQCRLLRAQAERVITAYDADSAGEAATWRGLALLQSTGCLVEVADLPAGADPDTLIRKEGPERFKKYLDEAVSLVEYRLKRLEAKYDLKTEVGRVGYVNELMPFLMTTVNQVEQNYYLKKSAETLGVDEEALRRELKKRNLKKSGGAKEGNNTLSVEVNSIGISVAEKILISLLLQSKEIAARGRKLIKPEYIVDDKVRIIFDHIWRLYEAEEAVSAEKLINSFEDSELAGVVTEAATNPALEDLSPQAIESNFYDSIQALHRRWVNRQLKELQKKREALEARGLHEEASELFLQESALAQEKNISSPDRLVKGGDFNG